MKMARYQALLFHPEPSRLRYPVSQLLDETRAAHFPQIGMAVEARFEAMGPLASIWYHLMGEDRHVVAFHPVLNHPDTPIEVMRFICKHELLHLVCPAREIDGVRVSHPPEFWERELEIGPERRAVWAWIHASLRGCSRSTQWGFTVTRRWHGYRDAARIPYTPELPFNGERWDRVCPGDGGQLLFPPEWSPRPMPLAM